MKTGTQVDAKRRAAGEKDENYDPPTKLVSLIDQTEVPTVTRGGKRSPMLETAEWKAACEHLNKGLPDKKVLAIPLSAETLKMQKTPKHSAIGFKRHLVLHAKRMNWNYTFALKGETIYASAKKK